MTLHSSWSAQLTDERPRFRYAAPLHAKLFLMMKRFFRSGCSKRLFSDSCVSKAAAES